MPRRPRIHLADVPVHLVQRGHNREPCFFAEGDYHRYLHWLGQGLAATGVVLHAYVLMTNHVHLLLTAHDPNAIAGLMISLGRRYVQSVNRRYQRTGTLWDSRYRASLIQTESHFLACQRYIELNPVRAGMVVDPACYRWSSYGFHAFGQPDKVLVPHPIYLEMGRTLSDRQRAYRTLARSELDADVIGEIRKAVNQNQPLGDARFLETIARATGAPRETRPRGRPKRTNA